MSCKATGASEKKGGADAVYNRKGSNATANVRLDTDCLSPAPRDTVDSTITTWCDGLEKRVGDIDGAGDAYGAGVDDFALDWSNTVVVDVDVLVAVDVVVWVDTVSHVCLVHGDEEFAVGSGRTAGSETDRDIVVGHVASE